MRDFLFKLLVLILAVVLCANFIRFMLTEDVGSLWVEYDFSPVSVSVFFDAVTEIGADARPLFADLYQLFDYFLELSESFTKIFADNYSTGGNILDNIKSFFWFIWHSATSAVLVVGNLLSLVYDFLKFVVDFMASLYKFLRTMFGTTFISDLWN